MPTPEQYESRADRQKAYRQRTQQARMQEQEAKGLPPLPAIPTLPGMARWKALHEQARAALDAMQSEMQGYFDDRSETWQEGERAGRSKRYLTGWRKPAPPLKTYRLNNL